MVRARQGISRMRTIQTGRKCILRCSGSRVGLDRRGDWLVPADVGAPLVTEPLSICIPGKEPLSLLSFTSRIPDYPRLCIMEDDLLRFLESVGRISPRRVNHDGGRTRPGTTGGRGTITWQPNSRTSSEGRRAYPAAPPVLPS